MSYVRLRSCGLAVLRLFSSFRCIFAVCHLPSHRAIYRHALTYIQFFLKKYASANAVPNIAIIVINPPRERTAMPLSADPLVQPLPSCDPKPNRTPPARAKIIRRRDVIFGECSTLNLSLPASAPKETRRQLLPAFQIQAMISLDYLMRFPEFFNE